MALTDTLATLRGCETQHDTAHGARVGFLMSDATRALGGLSQASNAIAVLLSDGLVNSESIVIGDDVHTLYRIADTAPPTVH